MHLCLVLLEMCRCSPSIASELVSQFWLVNRWPRRPSWQVHCTFPWPHFRAVGSEGTATKNVSNIKWVRTISDFAHQADHHGYIILVCHESLMDCRCTWFVSLSCIQKAFPNDSNCSQSIRERMLKQQWCVQVFDSILHNNTNERFLGRKS